MGKSRLLNALAGTQKLARVSSEPGRTRLINFFRVDQPPIYLVDLPGYGYAKVSEKIRRQWERMVSAYLEDRAQLSLCLFLLDARHPPSAGDRILHSYLTTRRLPHALVLTKGDKLTRGALNQQVTLLRRDLGEMAEDVIPTSATDGAGIDSLWNAIRAAASARRGFKEPQHARI